MNRIHSEKLVMFIAIMLSAIFMAIGQNIMDASAEGAAEIIDLLPADCEAEEDSVSDDSLLNALSVDADPVTADGELSDFLVPNDEAASEKNVQIAGGGHVILIYHTHTTEAYRMTEDSKYVQSSSYRTRDNEKNIVAVGEELKKELEAQGFIVYHDTTDHEPPKLATSYDRSVGTMEKYRDMYGADVFIDVHRDAADVEKAKDDVVTINSERCARMMFVVGKGTNYKVKPDFDSTYAVAAAVTAELEQVKKGFTREIRVKKGRYNQHISDLSMLVEIGHNANTLEEAKRSAKYLGKAIAAVLKG